jgi:hypothetical protein
MGGPADHLCPNNQLIDQNCEQARHFGVLVCRDKDGDLPFERLEGKSTLVTYAQKLFPCHTKFGTGVQSILVSTILIENPNASINAISDPDDLVIRYSRFPASSASRLRGYDTPVTVVPNRQLSWSRIPSTDLRVEKSAQAKSEKPVNTGSSEHTNQILHFHESRPRKWTIQILSRL